MGLAAREVAKLRPEDVDRVITLGSPLNMSHRSQSRASAAYEMFASRHPPDYAFEAWVAARKDGLAQPLTSIYSRADGIVHWQSCLVEPGPMSENVEVPGSHCGLGANGGPRTWSSTGWLSHSMTGSRSVRAGPTGARSPVVLSRPPADSTVTTTQQRIGPSSPHDGPIRCDIRGPVAGPDTIAGECQRVGRR